MLSLWINSFLTFLFYIYTGVRTTRINEDDDRVSATNKSEMYAIDCEMVNRDKLFYFQFNLVFSQN